MKTNNLVLVEQCCSLYEIEYSFMDALNDHGLIEIVVQKNKEYISIDQLRDVERAIRFHHDLNINVEAMDVISNLLQQINDLQQSLRIAQNKLNVFDWR